jgi:uncharacterized membrane protein YraQ (UPF0718 family)
VPGHTETGLYLRAFFLLFALGLFFVFSQEPWLKTFVLVFVSIVLEAFPFMLLGSMVSGFVEVFVSKERLAGLLPKGKVRLTLFASALGVAFPVCECAVVPVVRRFLRKGIPLSAAVAYLLAGPVFNPVVAASTAVAYASLPGWQTLWVVAIRLLSAFFIASAIGLIMGKLAPSRPLAADACKWHQDHAHDHGGRLKKRFLAALNHGVDEFLDVAQYLVVGAFIAGLLQTIISRQAFFLLASTPVLGLPLMMLLAFVLNLCSEADAFVAASFRGILPLSAQMAFMVLGPMLDIKLIIMYLGVFRKSTILLLSGLVVVCVLVVMLLLHGAMGPWYNLPAGLTPTGGP